MINAPFNRKLHDSLEMIRDNFSKFREDPSLPAYSNDTIDIESIQKLIPQDTIVIPSDKNLGVCLLPIHWFEKEYKAHIVKGGYEMQVF